MKRALALFALGVFADDRVKANHCLVVVFVGSGIAFDKRFKTISVGVYFGEDNLPNLPNSQ
jgi:hypothetical protein